MLNATLPIRQQLHHSFSNTLYHRPLHITSFKRCQDPNQVRVVQAEQLITQHGTAYSTCLSHHSGTLQQILFFLVWCSWQMSPRNAYSHTATILVHSLCSHITSCTEQGEYHRTDQEQHVWREDHYSTSKSVGTLFCLHPNRQKLHVRQ